jgi:hypothetical protein
MILFDDVVQVFALTQRNARFMVFVVADDRRGVGAALVDGDRLWFAVLIDCSLEKTACRRLVTTRGEQEVDGVTVAINGTVEIAPPAADLDLCLVHSPALAD